MEGAEVVTQENKDISPHVLPHTDPVPTSREITGHKKEDDPTSDVKIDINEDKNVKQDSREAKKEKEADEEKETEKPLLEDDSVKIDIKAGDEAGDTATLPLSEKKEGELQEMEEEKPEEKIPIYLFPCSRIKKAWNESTNIFQFFYTSICIIFQTVGWFTCVGGVPFLSLAFIVIGSIYVNDCKIEPNIPIYLIVSGVIGTLQHVITIWTKYVPKTSQGRLKLYRSYCNVTGGLFHLFMMIWFILGCIWVYSVHSEVDFIDPAKDEYCNKTLYYFTFWILNLSFIFLGLVVVLSLCFLLCFVAVVAKQ